MVVGYTLEATALRLSNLMAFDARALGNWGCAPELYPAVLDKVLSGRIDVVSHVALKPLSEIGPVLDEVRAHRADRRIVLVPGGKETA
jgi:6-hydroxycyclohex-1-ene-1-carbonyl-CoA dehydrogenase